MDLQKRQKHVGDDSYRVYDAADPQQHVSLPPHTPHSSPSIPASNLTNISSLFVFPILFVVLNLKNTSSLFSLKLLFLVVNLQKSSFLSTSLSMSVFAFPSTPVCLCWGGYGPLLSMVPSEGTVEKGGPYPPPYGGSVPPTEGVRTPTLRDRSILPPPYGGVRNPSKKNHTPVERNTNTDIDREVERNEKKMRCTTKRVFQIKRGMKCFSNSRLSSLRFVKNQYGLSIL